MSIMNVKMILKEKYDKKEVTHWYFVFDAKGSFFKIFCDDGSGFKISVAELEAYGYGTKINLTIVEYIDHLIARHKKKMQLAEEVMAYYKKRKEELGL